MAIGPNYFTFSNVLAVLRDKTVLALVVAVADFARVDSQRVAALWVSTTLVPSGIWERTSRAPFATPCRPGLDGSVTRPAAADSTLAGFLTGAPFLSVRTRRYEYQYATERLQTRACFLICSRRQQQTEWQLSI